jgi:hypothetical protein
LPAALFIVFQLDSKGPTGSTKTALLPANLGDVNNAGGGGAPIERENGGGMDHFMAIENKKTQVSSRKQK